MKRSLVLGVIAATFAIAQSTPVAFEVASVKPAPTGAVTGSMDGGPLPPGPFNRGNHDPGRITWTNIRLIRAIQIAYDIPVDRISAPDWVRSSGYNIVAIIPSGRP
ncbi:MAG: TIGR03435 family protein [Bryobacterales bacterium]|nr:TIGR03435 family protein [Bryobacterales bacterium]MBV9396560.1 TIGR03435 family protein [Bryobacterales bacterium]